MLGTLLDLSVSSGVASIPEEEEELVTRDSGYDNANADGPDELPRQAKPRPPSRHFNRLPLPSHSSNPRLLRKPSAPSPRSFPYNTPISREFLQFLPLNPPPVETLADCSECGVLLDSIPYMCPDLPAHSPKSHSPRYPSLER
ncbi:hypothetical protein B0H11DRAFT_2283719 [Mycena galericulata]|nr:hypothetical protein B0H11DRAFT_2283719 [Mycena galericulata]